MDEEQEEDEFEKEKGEEEEDELGTAAAAELYVRSYRGSLQFFFVGENISKNERNSDSRWRKACWDDVIPWMWFLRECNCCASMLLKLEAPLESEKD